MTRKIKVFLWLGAGFTGLSVAMLTATFSGRFDIAPMIGAWAGFGFYHFGALPARKAIFPVMSFVIILAGVNYFRFVQQHMLILIAAVGIGWAVVFAGQRLVRD